MLGLRQKKGMRIQSVIDYCGSGDKHVVQKKIASLQERDLITCAGDILSLTTRGMALEHEVILYLTS